MHPQPRAGLKQLALFIAVLLSCFRLMGTQVWVVVLGDIGRSPRMMYHCISLLQAGYDVTIIGTAGSALLPLLESAKQLRTIHIPKHPPIVESLPHSVALLAKALFQLLALLYVLLLVAPTPQVILTQNPPSVPTLPACWLASLLRGGTWVVDWHNFGYTLLLLKLGPAHALTRAYQYMEHTCGKRASKHVCVSRSMAAWMWDTWQVEAHVLQDRAPPWFCPTSNIDQHVLMTSLEAAMQVPLHPHDALTKHMAEVGIVDEQQLLESSLSGTVRRGAVGELSWEAGTRRLDVGEHLKQRTIRTEMFGNNVELTPTRPALVVSSTSWTPDEDFGLLLEAAKWYDSHVEGAYLQAAPDSDGEGQEVGPQQHYPLLLIIITGKGPQKEEYLAKLRSTEFTHVAFRTLWLEPEDYPRLLGSADLGVCLHASSSGLDLPMKVADMLGSGLPVCARAYSTLGEAVKPGVNGLMFDTGAQLGAQLLDLMEGFPHRASPMLQQLREGAQEAMAIRWQDSWQAVMPQLLPPL